MKLSHLVPDHAREAATEYRKFIRKVDLKDLEIPEEVGKSLLALHQNALMVNLMDSERASEVMEEML